MELTNEFRVAVPPAEAWSVLTDVERIAPCMPGAELQEVEGDEYRGIVKVKVGPITAQYKGKATFIDRDESGGKAVLRAEGRDTRGQGNANATITATLVPDGDGTKVTVTTDLAVTGRVAQFGRGVLADVSAKLLNQFVECLETNVLGEEPPPPPPHPEAHTMTVSASPAAAPPPPPATPPAATPSAATPSAATPSAGTPSAAATTPAAAAPEPAATVTATVSPSPDPATSSNGRSPSESSEERPGVRKIQSAPAQPVDLLDAAGGTVAKRAVPAIVVLLLIVLLLRRRRRHG